MLKLLPDYPPLESIETIRKKSLVQSPGIDLFDQTKPVSVAFETDTAPVKIVWAARWEHDKGPAWLLEVLDKLEANSVDFSISIVGQQYLRQPEEFGEIQKLHADRIEHWGFVSRALYDQILGDADIFLSTANHEFFGLSFVEAVTRGCCPVVPNAMAYPGLMRPVSGCEKLQYQTPQQAVEIIESLWRNPTEFRHVAHGLSDHFSKTYAWPIRAGQMDDRISELVTEVT